MLILTIYSQKRAISKKFPLLKVKIYGDSFSHFFRRSGKKSIFLAEYSPMDANALFFVENSLSAPDCFSNPSQNIRTVFVISLSWSRI